MVHENGEVNLLETKVEKTQTKRREASLIGTLSIEKEDSIQWEKGSEIMPVIKPEVKKKNTLQTISTRPGEKENLNWANNDLSPLAMSYDQEKGWIAEVLGPKSGHWKHLARQVKTKSPREESDPANQK